MNEPRALQIHPELCTGCKQCELACAWVQSASFQPSRSLIRVHIFDEQASYAPYTCFQCPEAWCMQACPVNAIDLDELTGAVVVLDDVCVGCGLCVIACPFGTMFFDRENHRAEKCDLCADDPACVHACPTKAIEYLPVEPTEQPWIGAFGLRVDREFREARQGEKS